ncbi:MAG: transposase [Erythrobacter sp.]|nr:MAG: transposase [Erythrobacter sp.]
MNETISTSRAHARQELKAWRQDYNHFRPHSSLRNRTPVEMGAGSSGISYRGMRPIRLFPSRPAMGTKTGQGSTPSW